MKKEEIIKRAIYTIVLSPFSLIGKFGEWILEKKLNSTTDKLAAIKITSIMDWLTAITPYIFIFCFLLAIIVWVWWILSDRIAAKNEYFNLLEQNINSVNVNIRYLKTLAQERGQSLDILTVARLFTVEEMKILGMSEDQIEKATDLLSRK